MPAKKLSAKDWERMEAYAHGYFCGRAGYELELLWSHECEMFPYQVEGFMAGHMNYIESGLEDMEDYDFDNPDDKDGKYVHIDIGKIDD